MQGDTGKCHCRRSDEETPRRLRAVLDAIDLARMGHRMTGPPADDERIDEANGKEPGELAADMLDPFITTEAAVANEQGRLQPAREQVQKSPSLCVLSRPRVRCKDKARRAARAGPAVLPS